MLKKIKNIINSFRSADTDDLPSYIDLEIDCESDPYALSCKAGDKLTLFKINGIGKVLGEDEFSEANKALLSCMKQLFDKKGVTIAWMFEQDQLKINESLKEGFRGAIATANRVGLKANDIILDEINGNNKLCQPEAQFIAIWTEPIYQVELKVSGKLERIKTEKAKLASKHGGIMPNAANPYLSEIGTTEGHAFNVGVLEAALKKFSCVHTKLKSKDALQELSERLNSGQQIRNKPFRLIQNNNDKNTVPQVGGNGLGINPKNGDIDFSSLFLPRLSEQLASRSLLEEPGAEDGLLKMGDTHYATHEMVIFPDRIVKFNNLINNLKGLPLRVTYLMSYPNKTLMERVNTSLCDFGKAHSENRKNFDQNQFQLGLYEDHGIPQINLQILITTWAPTKRKVLQNSERINQALSEWGSSSIELESCDPYETFTASIAGLNKRSSSVGCWISADRLAYMLPHQREARLWDHGGMLFRTSGGAPFFFQPQSPLQDYDYSIFIAPPRQGKSLGMNRKNIATLFQEGASDVNLMVIMDIGPTSKGALQIIRRMLKKKFGTERSNDLVQEILWEPSKKGWAVNPMDIRFGMHYPANYEFVFMTNFYCTVCSESETGKAKEGTESAIKEILNRTYKRLNDRGSSKKYNAALSEKLHKHITKNKLPITPDHTSLFDLRDILFQKNEVKLAHIAHSLAMPLTKDLVETINQDPIIKSSYKEAYPGLIEYIKIRLSESETSMPFLSKPTTLRLSDARIIAFDMRPITGDKTPAGVLKTFSQYLVAMHIGMEKFFLRDNYIGEILGNMPELYEQYWRQRVKEYSPLQKCLSIDEWHALTISMTAKDSGKKVTQTVAGAAYLEYLIKETPKWGISINMASHTPSDFTDTMLSMASNQFIFSGSEGVVIDDLKEQFGLSNTEHKLLKSGLHGPKAGIGNEILFRYRAKVDSIDQSMFSTRIKFLCTGTMLWGLNSQSEDMPHKHQLENEHPDGPWLQALINKFPSGTMASEREEIKKRLRDKSILDGDLTEEATTSVEVELHKIVEDELLRLQGSDVVGQVMNNLEKKKKS